jgi:putative FmdB family regulatory protein
VPIYDYVCGSCGHRFEVFRGINEAGPHQCPECGGPVARAFMPPTIHFKGSGWAKTDRRATSAPARRAETAASASGPPGSSPANGSGRPAESPGTSAGADATSSAGAVTPVKPTPPDADR